MSQDVDSALDITELVSGPAVVHGLDAVAAETAAEIPEPAGDLVFDVSDAAVYYGSFKAVREVNLRIRPHEITAFIGPSGCGKSTMLRCFNRMNDTIPGARVEGSLKYRNIDLYGLSLIHI